MGRSAVGGAVRWVERRVEVGGRAMADGLLQAVVRPDDQLPALLVRLAHVEGLVQVPCVRKAQCGKATSMGGMVPSMVEVVPSTVGVVSSMVGAVPSKVGVGT